MKETIISSIELHLQLEALGIMVSSDFWVAISAVGAVLAALVAIIMTALQIRASRRIASADFLLRFQNNFISKNMIERRKRIMLIRKKTPEAYQEMDALSDVLDFFEELGLLFRKGVLPEDLIWADYCYWILNYWIAFKGYVDWDRKAANDNTVYQEFEHLFEKTLSFEEDKRKRKITFDSKHIDEFLDDEINLLSSWKKAD
jgi:hypothetical protein